MPVPFVGMISDADAELAAISDYVDMLIIIYARPILINIYQWEIYQADGDIAPRILPRRRQNSDMPKSSAESTA